MQDYGPSTAVRRPRAPSRPGQGSEQHPMQDYGVPTHSHIHLKDQCNTPCRTTASSHAVTAGSTRLSATPRALDCGVPTRNHSRLKDQCNTPCRTTASPHAVTAGSRLSATPHAGLWRPHTQSRPGQGSVQHRVYETVRAYMLVELERMYPDTVLNLVFACDPDTHACMTVMHACPDTYLSI